MGCLANALRTFPIVTVFLLLALLATSGCSTSIHREEELLLATDAAFCSTAVVNGIPEAFLRYMTDDAVLLPMQGYPVNGREAIRSHLSEGGRTAFMTWTPVHADVSMGGDLGYTYGTCMAKGTDSAGAASTRYGKYVTIWRKQKDGTWKFVLDIGNPSPPPRTD